MGLAVSGYTVFMLGLFVLSVFALGLKAALWGFGILHVGCALVVLGLWRHEERTQSYMQDPDMPLDLTPGTSVFSPTGELIVPSLKNMSPLPNTLAESASDEPEPNLFEEQVKGITEGVSAVYPLINREDIHKIVWMSLLEMTHKQGQESAQDDGSIPEKIRKVA